jgi:hypothetical protein
MLHIDYTAVLTAAAVGFVTGAAWYSPFLFGRALSELRQAGHAAAKPRPPAVKILGEFARCLITAGVLGAFIHGFGLGA